MTERLLPFVRSLIGGGLLLLTISTFAPKLSAEPALPEPVGGSVALKDPYRLVGLLRFFSGKGEAIGTATIVTPRGILSCAHTMYSKENGFSFEIQFERGRYGTRVIRVSKPVSISVLTGYTDSVDKHGEANPNSFDRDISVLGFKNTLSGGQTLPVRTSLKDLTTEGIKKTGLGYGGVVHDGETLLGVTSEAAWKPIKPAFYKCRDALLEPGMSGGPVIINLNGARPFVAAVNVAGSSVLSGYRIVTDEVLRLIKSNLQ